MDIQSCNISSHCLILSTLTTDTNSKLSSASVQVAHFGRSREGGTKNRSHRMMPRKMRVCHLQVGGKPMAPSRWSFCAICLIMLNGCWSMSARVDREVDGLSALVDQVEIHPALDPSPPPASKDN